LFLMLERFIKLKDCIHKALYDLKIVFDFTEEDFINLKHLVNALEPIKEAVEKLSSRGIDLLEADLFFEYMLDKLYEQDSEISFALRFALIDRIKARRTILSNLSFYLSTGDISSEIHSKLMTMPPTKSQIFDKLLKRVTSTVEPTIENTVELGEAKQSNEIQSASLDQFMRNRLEKIVKKMGTRDPDIVCNLKTEMQLYEMKGTKGPLLKMCTSSIKAVRPTSVESERVFSTSSYFCNKILSNLSDNMLDIQCFLKSFFLSS
jgi:hypothetical protein